MAVFKVISGGQIGADIAGLRAAKAIGLKTGGYCPKGWRQKDGPNPALGTEYGLVEHSSPDYPPRTYMNVKSSDGTIRFAKNFQSAGEICTLKAIQQYNKPYLDVRFLWNGIHYITKVSPDSVREWLEHNNIRVLNVAGNAEPAMEPAVFSFLTEVLRGEQ